LPDEGPRAIMDDHGHREEFPTKKRGVLTSRPTINFAGSKHPAPRQARDVHPAHPSQVP